MDLRRFVVNLARLCEEMEVFGNRLEVLRLSRVTAMRRTVSTTMRPKVEGLDGGRSSTCGIPWRMHPPGMPGDERFEVVQHKEVIPGKRLWCGRDVFQVGCVAFQLQLGACLGWEQLETCPGVMPR